uniref:Uncharacterized protein n=1 Tax=Varanus komodoensis TaxID=61221 RepID=A0A8D2IV20_VARKO
SNPTFFYLVTESTCSICLDFFKDPLMITECGHNFCRACLSQCSGESDTEASCPQCRRTFQKRNLRPNRQLANIVEIARVLSGQWGRGAEGKGRLCATHQEKLLLFCKEDEELVCWKCKHSPEHETHTVLLKEEVAQQCCCWNLATWACGAPDSQPNKSLETRL